jgi:hypothetical protein
MGGQVPGAFKKVLNAVEEEEGARKRADAAGGLK